jgi:hypothetical protein
MRPSHWKSSFYLPDLKFTATASESQPNAAQPYNRHRQSIPLVRPNCGYFVKLLFGLFVATAIAFLALFIRPIDLDPRFGLGVGAIFASVTSALTLTLGC